MLDQRKEKGSGTTDGSEGPRSVQGKNDGNRKKGKSDEHGMEMV